MAISADAVWEVRTAGDNTNGGAFVTGASGTDWSQQNGKRTGADVTDISTTDAVANGTTTITSATANFAATIVGNVIYLQGGTGSLAITRRQVTARTNATTITVDATVATGTGITMNIGGALASIGEAGRNFVDSNIVWVKSGSYTITSASQNVAGGCFSGAGNGSIIGYDSVRGDWGTPPVLTASGISTFTMINLGGSTANNLIANLTLNGATLTSSRAISANNRMLVYKCTVQNCTNSGISSASNSIVIDCLATGCTTQTAFSFSGPSYGCVADGNTAAGFTISSSICINCYSINNTGATTDGFTLGGASSRFIGCVAYNNGRNGFNFVSGNSQAINCISEDNATNGFTAVNNPSVVWLNCAAFSNTTANFVIGTGKGAMNIGNITLTSSAFTNAAGDDFTLNNTAGGGADLRATGFPTSYKGLSTPNFLDIGAAQHQDGGGGGSTEHSAVF